MSDVHVYEGKTTNEAIEKGLKELNVSRNKVDIKVLEDEDKKTFFNILTPRVVKVEMSLKEGHENIPDEKPKEKKEYKTPEFNENKMKEKMASFLNEFISYLPENNIKYDISIEDGSVLINFMGNELGYLIGYRGEVLNSLQAILTNIASKDVEGKVRVQLNIAGYREKRKKDLENLADKIARSVVRTKKSITIEPMTAYERKIIHTRLQDSDKVTTHSVGEEPYRKVVVSLK